MDALVRDYSATIAATPVCHPGVKTTLAARYPDAAAVHHATHGSASVQSAAVVHLSAAAVRQTLSAVNPAVAAMAVYAAVQLAQQVVAAIAPAAGSLSAALVAAAAAGEPVSAVDQLTQAVAGRPAAQLSVAVTSSANVSTVASVQTVSVALCSAVLTDLAPLAAGFSVQAAELRLLLFVCQARVHALTDPAQSVLDSDMLPAVRLSPSQLSLHEPLQTGDIM